MFHMCLHNSFLWQLSTFSVTPLGEDSWNPLLRSLQTSSHAPFPSANFTFYSYTVKKYQWVNYMLSPVSSPSKSFNLGSEGSSDPLIWSLFKCLQYELDLKQACGLYLFCPTALRPRVFSNLISLNYSPGLLSQRHHITRKHFQAQLHDRNGEDPVEEKNPQSQEHAGSSASSIVIPKLFKVNVWGVIDTECTSFLLRCRVRHVLLRFQYWFLELLLILFFGSKYSLYSLIVTEEICVRDLSLFSPCLTQESWTQARDKMYNGNEVACLFMKYIWAWNWKWAPSLCECLNHWGFRYFMLAASFQPPLPPLFSGLWGLTYSFKDFLFQIVEKIKVPLLSACGLSWDLWNIWQSV